ncbi:sulfur oxidation c-type cytochrome SoxA [Roseomonas xinghualingensis]|uniref:sulfur oxidation c-type cytochrome SoxA n=1 Tax=Roseomonas xinghualingensis TaxID=2986475 RepID=UPI0021F18772|nr:sulfur oxidation c-type cytochrome SoxA [Roseomonas sp. SXEYE001]MCV4209721.1 sulfur oxidation c-type cytochrome SoxA [Roseomonas sp. SXEYE001]
MTRRRRAMLVAMLVLSLGGAEAVGPGERRSGFDDMAPETRAMQLDDMANPGMLWVAEGEAAWRRPAGPAGRSCAGCHGEAEASMRGIATRHPGWDQAAARPISLEDRINLCRRERQGGEPFAPESDDLLALSAYVAHQSRGMPIALPDDPRLTPFREQGRHIFEQRRGQLNLSCAQCHEEHAGRRLAGSVIPQGHPTGYPIYRLEWQSLGSLRRRLRNCTVGVRSEPLDEQEAVALELFLMFRANGMPMESPAIRP